MITKDVCKKYRKKPRLLNPRDTRGIAEQLMRIVFSKYSDLLKVIVTKQIWRL